MNTMTTLTIDGRETRLLSIITPLATDINVNVETAQLQVGDITLTHAELPGFTLIFERKTGADLTSSISDGRYREQKKRIVSMIDKSYHMTYIIENKTTCTLPKAVFDGVVLNTMYRDGMHVVFTEDTTDTAKWLITLAHKIAKHPQKFATPMSPPSGLQIDYMAYVKVKTKKSDNIDVKTCYMLQLGQIPGVSVKLAKTISEIYPTMYEFLKVLNDNGHQNALKLLCELPLIGTKKAKVILNYLGVAASGS